MSDNVTAIKGFADLFSPDSDAFTHMEAVARETFSRYGFTELRTPILERTELFCRGIGTETDVVQKEMYTFPDRKGRSLTLRPEATAGVMRAYIESGRSGDAVTKLFTIGPMFRYERPQKGRLREFVQCDIDILGDESPNAEVELIDVTTRALLGIGFDDFTVNINDRRILRGMLESMGFAADTLDSVCITFDKMDKIGADGVKAELLEKQLPESAVNALADFIAAGEVTLDAVADAVALRTAPSVAYRHNHHHALPEHS